MKKIKFLLKKIAPKSIIDLIKYTKYFIFNFGWFDYFYLMNKDLLKDQNKKVSIIIPSHNNTKYLREAIESALNQTYKNTEVLVMTDLPELGVKNIIGDLINKIHFFEEPNLHSVDKFNELVKRSSGELIVFLCDDDLIDCRFIEKTVYLLNKKNVDMVYVDAELFGNIFQFDPAHKWIKKEINKTSPCSLTTLYKKEVWSSIGGYESIGYFDWSFYYKMFKSGIKTYHLKQPLMKYRIHQGQDTNLCNHTEAKKQIRETYINKKISILLVGPGAMEIPSKGWGAVETVIWQLKVHLEKLGHKVDILNKTGLKNALSSKPKEYDIVHLEYDNHAGIWILLSKILRFKLIITSHYGYSAWPKKWHRSYWPVFFKLLLSPAMIVLSPEIKQVFLKFFYKGFIEVLPNGTEVDKINFSIKAEKDLICLGKIEPRKKQKQLSETFSKQKDVTVDFVGPIADKSFSYNNISTKYLSTWTREEVKENLTKYKALILLSDGEAHALVVGEALAAGLSLIISSEVSANLDLKMPFIHIVKDEEEARQIAKKVCEDNKNYRNEIRMYAKNNFDWAHIAEKYIQIVTKYKLHS